jgi:hypothetical protein
VAVSGLYSPKRTGDPGTDATPVLLGIEVLPQRLFSVRSKKTVSEKIFLILRILFLHFHLSTSFFPYLLWVAARDASEPI